MIYNPIYSASQYPDLATALGDVILAWNEAEQTQVSMMAAMLEIPYYRASQLYYQIPNFRGRTRALYALIDSTEGFDEFKSFVAKFSKLSKTRNEVVHGAFIRHVSGSELRRIRMDEPIGKATRSVVTKTGDISQHADAVRLVSTTFRETGKLIPAYKSWLEPDPAET